MDQPDTRHLRKGKYLPLSETMAPTTVESYDGQNIAIGRELRYTLGNYLGGGIAGIVYEAYDRREHRQVAIKILNPIGYKLMSPMALKKCSVVVKGKTPITSIKARITRDQLWWVVHPHTKQFLAAFQDPATGTLHELPLNKCMELWGLEASATSHLETVVDEDPLYEGYPGTSPKQTDPFQLQVQVGESMLQSPNIPPKFVAFLKNRKSIYREIAHMHKLTGNGRIGQIGGGHGNVLKLHNVLELTQTSKTTIFLVLELATGGELFDRIRPDCGLEEQAAQLYFRQLLGGVSYCHQLGIVHRDLKPENILLSDTDEIKIADFGLSAHFIAAVVHDSIDGRCVNQGHEQSRFRRLNSVVGSPHYVAPEVLQTDRYGYDGRKADMWSLGVILYGMLVGAIPFGQELHYCGKYAKFSDWIRSIPHESSTGRLATTKTYYDGSIRSPGAQTIAAVTAELQVNHISTRPNTSWWDQRASQSAVPSAPVEFPHWFFPRHMSIPARILLTGLLHPDPAKRLSCEEASRYEWVVEEQ